MQLLPTMLSPNVFRNIRCIIVIIHDDLGRVGAPKTGAAAWCAVSLGLGRGQPLDVSSLVGLAERWREIPARDLGETPEVSTHCLVHGPRNGSIAA
jgi:hypothetical protein